MKGNILFSFVFLMLLRLYLININICITLIHSPIYVTTILLQLSRCCFITDCPDNKIWLGLHQAYLDYASFGVCMFRSRSH